MIQTKCFTEIAGSDLTVASNKVSEKTNKWIEEHPSYQIKSIKVNLNRFNYIHTIIYDDMNIVK